MTTRILFLAISLTAMNGLSPLRAQQGTTEGIAWVSMEEALDMIAHNDYKLFIDFYTDWCGWCKVQDKTTFQDPEIIRLVNENFIPVKFNAEQKEPITMGGKEYKFVPSGPRGYHELAAYFLQGKMSYPTILLINEQKEIFMLPGYQKPETLGPILDFYGNNHYLDPNLSWEEFMQEYEKTKKDN